MASLSPSAGGQDAAATELDANLKAAAFPELQRKCTELKIDFEPSIDSELVHIERRKDVNKSRKKQLSPSSNAASCLMDSCTDALIQLMH